MDCNEIKFSGHVLIKIFARKISLASVEEAVVNGEIIKSYSDDKPYPSYLLLSIINNRPLHMVLAKEDKSGICIVIKAYQPDSKIWSHDFKTKQ